MILGSPQCHHAKSGHWLSYEVGRGIESAVGCARAVSETHAPSQTANRVLSMDMIHISNMPSPVPPHTDTSMFFFFNDHLYNCTLIHRTWCGLTGWVRFQVPARIVLLIRVSELYQEEEFSVLRVLRVIMFLSWCQQKLPFSVFLLLCSKCLCHELLSHYVHISSFPGKNMIDIFAHPVHCQHTRTTRAQFTCIYPHLS